MYDPCSSCPKGEYSQPYCSAQCVYGKDLDELKMLREQTKKLAEVVGGELVQGIDADTCTIEEKPTTPRLHLRRLLPKRTMNSLCVRPN